MEILAGVVVVCGVGSHDGPRFVGVRSQDGVGDFCWGRGGVWIWHMVGWYQLVRWARHWGFLLGSWGCAVLARTWFVFVAGAVLGILAGVVEVWDGWMGGGGLRGFVWDGWIVGVHGEVSGVPRKQES